MRKIRSYVVRAGRMTPSQERALEALWPQFGLEYQENMLSLPDVFGNDSPVTLEIGFGMGASLLAMAEAQPDRNFLGVEVHPPGVGSLLAGVQAQGLTNLRVIKHDAVEVLQYMLPDTALDCVQIFFSDPWPKKKHHKRRLVQLPFITRLVEKLASGGHIHLATDWEGYAEHMMEVLSACPMLTNTQGKGQYLLKQALRPKTKFEVRGLKLGHGVWDLLFVRDTA